MFSGPPGPSPRGRGGSAAVVFSTSRPAAASSSKTVPTFFAVSTSSASSPTDSFVSCTGNVYSYSRLFFSAPRSTGSDSPPSAVPSAISASRSSVLQPEDLPPGRAVLAAVPAHEVAEQLVPGVVQPRGQLQLGGLDVADRLGVGCAVAAATAAAAARAAPPARRAAAPATRAARGSSRRRPCCRTRSSSSFCCVAVGQPLLVHRARCRARWPPRPRATGRRTPRPS